jgi:hypothetical protein
MCIYSAAFVSSTFNAHTRWEDVHLCGVLFWQLEESVSYDPLEVFGFICLSFLSFFARTKREFYGLYASVRKGRDEGTLFLPILFHCFYFLLSFLSAYGGYGLGYDTRRAKNGPARIEVSADPETWKNDDNESRNRYTKNSKMIHLQSASLSP